MGRRVCGEAERGIGRAAIQVTPLADWGSMLAPARVLSESGFTGFSGFYRLVFDRRALIRIRLGGIFRYGENLKMGEVKS